MKKDMKFAERLNGIMDLRQMTQADLARLLGCSQGTVSGWVNGTVPQRRHGFLLAEKLKLDPQWLINGLSPAPVGMLVEVERKKADTDKRASLLNEFNEAIESVAAGLSSARSALAECRRLFNNLK